MNKYEYGTVGNISLIIKDNSLDFKEISNNFNLENITITRKGDIISNAFGEAKYDTWLYQLKIDVNENINDAFKRFIKSIANAKEFIKLIVLEHDICIKLYLQSDFAQIGFELSSDVINSIAGLNLKLELSILSWGGVKD